METLDVQFLTNGQAHTRNNAAYKRMFEKNYITSQRCLPELIYTTHTSKVFPVKFYFFELPPPPYRRRICICHILVTEITFWKSARNKVPLHNVQVSISKN
jgi:hypothetical protein